MDLSKITITQTPPPEGTSDIPFQALTKDDVWGKYKTIDGITEKVSSGMVAARGTGANEICPIFGDRLGYKDTTFICEKSQVDDVLYWITYVHGEDCITKEKDLGSGKVAFRSEYQCW